MTALPSPTHTAPFSVPGEISGANAQFGEREPSKVSFSGVVSNHYRWSVVRRVMLEVRSVGPTSGLSFFPAVFVSFAFIL